VDAATYLLHHLLLLLGRGCPALLHLLPLAASLQRPAVHAAAGVLL
jgi:hypothetical protein